MGLLTSIIFGAPGFVLAIMVHESAHAFAAYHLGDPTAKNMGRVSLDPRRHLEPLGAIIYVATMVFSGGRFGFGWAKPVMINPYNFRDPRRDMMLSSLAGPAANLAQALVWALGLKEYAALSALPSLLVLQRAVSAADPIGFMIFFGILINVVLAVFNMIPIPPLDGSRLLAWLLPESYAHYLDRMEPYGIMIVFALLFLKVFDVIFAAVGWPLLELYLRIAVGG